METKIEQKQKDAQADQSNRQKIKSELEENVFIILLIRL
jgi:hypothetical protein